MKGSRIRWIVGGAATALGVGVPLAATVAVASHWHPAIWLASTLASLGGVVFLLDAMARAREAENRAADRTVFNEGIAVLCAAIGENARRVEAAADRHARRVEEVTRGHGVQLRDDVYTIMANTWRGEALAASDARETAARKVGSDTGPMQAISG